MQAIPAFLLATAFSYFAAFVYAMLGKPALADMDPNVQKFFYFAMGVAFLFVAFFPVVSLLNFVLGCLYGFAAMGSFIGWPQKWMAYWKPAPEMGSGAGQAMMAGWDLACAVVFFSLC